MTAAVRREGARTPELSRAGAFGRVCLCYCMAIGAFSLGHEWLTRSGAISSWHQLWIAAALYGLATLVVFLFSFRYDNSSFYDAFWSVAPPLLGAHWWLAFGAEGTLERQLLVLGLVLLWGVRLTWNWARGFGGLAHEDFRYVDLRQKTGRAYWLVSLLGLHGFPSVQTFLGSLPLWYALTSPAPFGVWDALAAGVTLAAVVIETVADEQLRRFASQKKPGQVLESGLWAWSRHPNYFGEVLFWVGVFGMGLAAGAPWWTGIGALGIGLMIAFVSIPMMEQRSLARRPEYAETQRRVSRLIPWPSRPRAP